MFSFWREKLLESFSQQKRKLKKIKKQRHLDKYLVSSLNKTKFPTLQQLKHLTKILNKWEKRQIKFLATVIFICLIILTVKTYLLSTVAVPQKGGEYVEGLINSPRFINPILAQTDVDKDLAKLIFSGLLKYDKNNQLVPDLAEKYEISADQLIYTFYLRPNVKWHDNEPFKADDVVFTVASIQDPEFKSPLTRSFRMISAEKIDDFTVRFILKEPFAPFLGLLTFGILPEHLWYSIPPANADLTELNKKPVGTGAWKFDSFKKDKNGVIKSFALIPNPDYYDQKPLLQKIIFKFYGDFESGIEALKSKEIDGLAYLPKIYQNNLAKNKNINYHNLNHSQYTAVFFNQRKNELLKADYLRQALALAIDKNMILKEVFNGEGRMIDSPTLPGVETEPDIKKYEYNPEAAAQLLEKNGWQLVSTTTSEGISEQIRKKSNWYLTINLTTVNNPQNIKTLELIKKFWDYIGCKTNLIIVEQTKILQEVINRREYEALLIAENLGSDPDPFPFWHSSQNEHPGLNLAIFTNKEVDKLLEDARKTNNWEERKKNYLQFQKIVAEQLPAIFLYNPVYIYPQDKKIKGFDLSGIAAPADRFANINEWYVKTKRVWK